MNCGSFKPVAGLAGALGLVLLAGGCGRQARTPPAADAPPVRVSVAAAMQEDLPLLVEAMGSVRAVRRASVAAKVMGTIDELPVLLGQRVRQGDVLARIGAAEIGAQVRQAQANLSGLRRDLERERGLAEKGAGTREAVAALQDRIAAAEAVLREAEAMQSYTVVRAPFDGAVSRRMAEAGDLASPGVPLLELEGTDAFEVEAEVPESAAAGLVQGTVVDVAVPGAGLAFAGPVAEVAAASDRRTRSVTVKVAVPAGKTVRAGQFARLQVALATVPAIMAPASAVSLVGQIERVFVVGSDGRAALRLVRTGARRGDRVEVLAGLAAGERVVLSPGALRDGRQVEVAP